jgi:hypothetical protein
MLVAVLITVANFLLLVTMGWQLRTQATRRELVRISKALCAVYKSENCKINSDFIDGQCFMLNKIFDYTDKFDLFGWTKEYWTMTKKMPQVIKGMFQRKKTEAKKEVAQKG